MRPNLASNSSDGLSLSFLTSGVTTNTDSFKNGYRLHHFSISVSVIFLILFLILFTAIVKNSTKRIDDTIFALNINIKDLGKDFENVKLEYEYLSSTEKLLEFQNLYFDNELIKKDIKEIKIINKELNKLKIEQLKFINE